MDDITGKALLDYYYHRRPSKLWIHNTYGPKEEMPLGVYFRTEADMPEMELTALQLCKGRVLDVGAGAGCHSLVLQDSGLSVTSLEISPGAVSVMQDRGVNNIVNADFFTFSETGFDTVLLLMNGIGLAQTLDGFDRLLKHAEKLLAPGGQLLFDSSDIAYLYEDGMPEKGDYYGEMQYAYEYKKQKGEWFKWLYIDQETMKKRAGKLGWDCIIIEEDEYDQYLAKLVKSNKK